MRKRSKALALLLTVAMTFTSFTVPAFAEEAVAEEIVTEAVEEETEIQAEAQEEDVTGMYGAGEVFYATSFDDFAKLLSEAATDKTTTVYVEASWGEENDKDYTVSSNVVVNGNVDIIFETDPNFILADDKDGKSIPASFTVNKGATVTMTGRAVDMPFNFVNSGVLTIDMAAYIAPEKGVAFTNEAEGSASIAGGARVKSLEKNKSSIDNKGILDLWNCTIEGAGREIPDGAEKAPETYAIVNTGKIVSERVIAHSANYGTDYEATETAVNGDIYNAAGATADLRGTSNFYVRWIVNKGNLIVGGEGEDSDHVSAVARIDSIEGGATVLHERAVVQRVNLAVRGSSADGTLTMTGGYIWDSVWYKTNAPKLYGGIVSCVHHGYDADKQLWVEKGNIVETGDNVSYAVHKITEFSETVGMAKTTPGNIINASGAEISTAKSDKEVSTVIYNGKPFNEKVSAALAGITWKEIRTLSELKAAAAAGGYYKVLRDIEIYDAVTVSATEPLYLDTTSETTDEGLQEGRLTFTVFGDSIGSLTVNEGATLNFVDRDDDIDTDIYVSSDISGEKKDGKTTVNTVITNKGTMTLEEVDISVAYSSQYLTFISNAGTLTWDDGTNIYCYNLENSTIINNTGVLTVAGNNSNYISTRIEIVNGQSVIAIYNAGTAEILGGRIDVEDSDADSAAILYKAGNEVLLTGGYIYGARGTSTNVITKYLYKEDGTPDLDDNGKRKKSENPVYGSAVIAEGFTTGSYRTASSKEPVSSKNAGYIALGDIPYEINLHADSDYRYMLMEKGEAALKDDIFYIDIVGNTFGKEPEDLVTITTNKADVAAVAQKTLNEIDSEKYTSDDDKTEKYDAVVATAFGQAIITATEEISGATDTVTVEVVTSRKALVADNYTVNIGSSVYNLNAYRTGLDMELEWYLNKDATGAMYEANNSFKPERVILTGATVETQQQLDRYFDNAAYLDLDFDSELKTYNFELETTQVPGGVTTFLAQDEVKEIRDIAVNVLVYNKAAKKTIEITLPATFDIVIDQKRPVVKFKKYTINGAYTDEGFNAYVLNDLITTDYTVDSIASPNFEINNDFVWNNSNRGGYTYAGAAKNKSYKLPVSVQLEGYVGYYEGILPLAVKSTYPKLMLDQKKIVVPKGQANYRDIVLDILSKDETAIRHIAGVTTTSADYSVLGLENAGYSALYDSAKKIYSVAGVGDIALRPNGDLTKATKVELLVSFDNLKYKKGVPYTQKLTVTVSPVDESKFKLSAQKGVKPTLYVYKDEAGVIKDGRPNPQYINVIMNPGNYTNGYFTVSSLDGKISVDEYGVVRGVQNTGALQIKVTAGSALTEKDKKAELLVKWYSAEGTQLGKDLKLKVAIDSKASSVGEIKKPVVVNLTKPYLPYMDEEDYVKSMGGLVKTKVVNASPEYGDTEDGRFCVEWTGKMGTYLIHPTAEALKAGKIAAGNEYDEVLHFTGFDYKTYDVAIKIKVVSSKVTAELVHDTSDITMSGITNAARNTFAVKTTIPYFGLKVASAKLTGKDAANYVLSESRREQVVTGRGYWDNQGSYDDDWTNNSTFNYYTIAYANNTLPAGIKAGKQNVEIELTYTDGSTAKVKLPVVVVGSMTTAATK